MPDVTGLKASVRERDGFRCTQCGMTNEEHVERYAKQLHVHRLVPGSVYTVEGCVTLCFTCHGPQPKREPGQPDLGNPDRHLHPRYAFHMEQALLDAIDRCCEAQRIPPDRSDVVRLALREFLEREGYWPPSEDD